MNYTIPPTYRLVAAGAFWLFTTLVHAQSASSPSLAVVVKADQTIEISWPAAAPAVVLEQNGSLSRADAWLAVSPIPARQGDHFAFSVNPTEQAQFYRLRLVQAAPAFTISGFTPLDGATDVGVTVRPQISFSQPVNPATLGPNNFYASFGGQTLPATVVPANDGAFAWLFLKQPMPGGARVRITVDGSSITAAQGGSALDAAGAGTPGGVLTYDFTTVSLAPLAGTSLSGIVVDPGPDLIPRSDDDLQPGPDGRLGTADDVFLLPIEGVKVYLLGREDQVVMTGADGRFHFDAVPGGDVKVALDGNTASHPPAGMYFPEMVIDAQMVVGVENHTMTNGPEVYLPRLAKSILQAVSSANTNLIQATPDGAPNLSAFQRNQLSITVAPNSLIGANGQTLTSGQIGISTVPSELVRDMLPAGVLQHTFDITIQAPGIATFATPAPMSFPNVFNAAPGTQLNFLSFDHTTGRLVIEGTATVSADGASVRTDPGTGVTHPGWHGLTPPGGPAGPGGPDRSDGPPALCDIDLGAGASGLASVTTGRSRQPSSLAGSINLNVPRALPMIVGETGVLSDPGLTWAAPAAGGDVCGLKVKIEVDGPLEKFMKKTGNLALKSQTFTLRPFTLGSSPPKTKILGGMAKSYDEVFGPGKFTNFFSDELVGARIKVTASLLKSTGPPDVTVDTYYLYRWVNVNYPPGFLGGPGAAAANATAAFRKTLNDGIGGWSTIKTVVASLPTNNPTHFSIALPPLSPKHFDVSSPLANNQFRWEFDPDAETSFLQDMSIQVDDGFNTEVGKLTLLGHGVNPARVNLNLEGYKAELKRVILSLRNVTARPPLPNPGLIFPIYVFSADAPGLPPAVITGQASGPGGVLFPEDHLNYVPGGATNVSDGLDLRLGTSDDVGYKRWILASSYFQQSFPGFMPSNRHLLGPDGIVGSPDDDFDFVQLTTLDSLVNAEAAQLAGQVAQQFQRVNFLNSAIQFVDTGETVNCEWHDVFVTLGGGRGDGTASPGMPVFGVGDQGNDRVSLTNLLPHPKLPLGAKFWALAEGLNTHASSRVRLSVAMHINYASPDVFAAYVANTVSHEIGHTLGLLDAYANDKKVGTALCRPTSGSCTPFDIMRNGQTTDPYLEFAPANIGLLKASVGVSSSGPLSFAKNEVPLLGELRQYRKTFNLATSSTGIRENNPLDPPPTVPEISLFQEDNSFFGEADEALEIAGEVAADGPGGDLIDVPFTIFNSGYGPLTVSILAFASGTKGFTLLNANSILGQPITPGHSTNFMVRFDPSAGGTASDLLQIVSDAATVPILSIPITATAYASAPTAQVELIGNNNFGGAIPGTAAIALPEIFRVRNAGQTPLRIAAISFVQGAQAFALTGVPANLASQPLQLAHGQSITFGGRFQPDQAGLRRALIEIKTNDPQSPIVRVSFVGTGLGVPMEAQWGDDFVAIDSPDFPATPPLRVKSSEKGNFEFFLTSQEFYHLTIFDPVTGLIGHETGVTEPSGQRTVLVDTMVFMASTEQDSDYDGLPDDIEFAIGTDPHKIDTDGDGIDDFVAVLQGVDPLGGRAAVTGIIAQVPVNDYANDVVVAPNAKGEAQLAYVADYSGGLVIVDVTRPSQPKVAARLALRGKSFFVSVDPVWQVAAITADSFVHLVDVSDPQSPKLIQSYPVGAPSQVAAVDGYAYFEANYGTLYALNTRSGIFEQHIDLPGNYISSVVHEGDFLYIMDSNYLLRIVQINGAQMSLRGSLQIAGAAGRFVVANGIAYIPLAGRSDPLTGVTVTGGYATFDVSDPDKPVLITNTSVPAGTSEPGAVLAMSGSGFGLILGTAPGGGGNVADLLNVSDPKNTYAFLTRFVLPERPYAATIASGTAFIADGTAGLVILNYQAFDTAGLPPTAAIAGVFAESDPTRPSTEIIEGSRFRVQATVADDAQVSQVELLVNGQVIQSSRAVPFDLASFAPNISGASNSFAVQVRVTDTGGNVGLSQPTVVHLLRDSTPPVWLKSDPAEGDEKFRGLASVILSFSEPLAGTSLMSTNFEIIHESGLVTRPTAFTQRDFNREVELTIPPLDLPGNYRLVIHAATVADGAANPLGRADITRAFSVLPYSIRWNRAETANWFTATNWVPQRTPIPTDWVYIGAVPTNAAVHLYSHNPAVPDLEKVRVRGLVSEADLVLLYCELQVDEPFLCDGSLYLTASKLTDTVLVAGPRSVLGYNLGATSPFVTREGYFSVLDGVTLRGDLEMKTEYHILNRLTVEGNIYGKVDRKSGFNGLLHATRDTVIQGPGTFHDLPFEVSSAELNAPDRPGPLVTISSDVTFRGALNIALEGSSSRLINRGKLLADDPLPFASGRYYTALNTGGIGTNVFLINEGTIQVSNGYRLLISGTQLINRGVLQADTNSFLWLNVPLISAKVRCEAGGVVQLSGRGVPWTTDAGQVSELSGPGRWLAGEIEFRGGTVRLTDGAILEGTAVFNGVTFEGELHNYDWNSRQAALPDFLLAYGNQVQVLTNMTLNGLIAFHRQSSTENGGRFFLLGAQSRLDGQGHIEFEGPSRANQILGGGFADASGFLTIGPNITIHGQSLTIGTVPGDYTQPPFVENQGTILTQPGDFLSFGTYGFTNSGVIHIAGTNQVNVRFNFDQTAAGRLEFEASNSPTGPASGQLSVAGTATLDGALKLSLIAPFQPAAGDSFGLLTYPSVQGRFTSLLAPPAPLGLEYVADYGPKSFRLRVGSKGAGAIAHGGLTP